MATWNLGELIYMKRDLADVIFVVDGEEIPGHRVVLSAVCPHFETLLYGHFKESNSKHVEIQETSPKVFKELMRFIYKGQLDVLNWTIEELLALMALAHRYEFKVLIEKTVELLKDKPLDSDSWTLVNDVASLYDSVALKEKCISFTENKIYDFLVQKDLDTFSAQFISSMLESPRVAHCNQDQVLSSILKWKSSQGSPAMISWLEKVCWEKVSPEVTSIIVKELLSKVKNAEDYQFWTPSLTVVKKLKTMEGEIHIDRVDSLVLRNNTEIEFFLPNNKCSLFCKFSLHSWTLTWLFKNNGSSVNIPVKGIVFETITKIKIQNIHAYKPHYPLNYFVVFESASNDGCFKYSAIMTCATPVNQISVQSEDFKNMSEIRIQNIVIN